MSDIPKDLQAQADKAVALQLEVSAKVAELKSAQKQIDETWDAVEQAMIDNNIKSIKGDWGSLTIAERNTFRAEDIDTVPRKFIKKALDTRKVDAHMKLTGELPKGVTSSQTRYLTKRIKEAN